MTRICGLVEEKGNSETRTGRMRKGRAASMIVLCPTRELARQLQEELNEVARPLGLSTMVFHGGVSYDAQTCNLRNGLDVLVGMPVRFIDHINNGNLDLSEADTKRRHGRGPTDRGGAKMNTKEELKWLKIKKKSIYSILIFLLCRVAAVAG